MLKLNFKENLNEQIRKNRQGRGRIHLQNKRA